MCIEKSGDKFLISQIAQIAIIALKDVVNKSLAKQRITHMLIKPSASFNDRREIAKVDQNSQEDSSEPVESAAKLDNGP